MGDLTLPPTSAGALFLYRGGGITPCRPVMTGDVFADVEIPGVDGGPGLALVLTHPCSMRSGGHVRERVMACRVEDGPPIRQDKWATGFFNVMPLPGLAATGDLGHRAVFELSGRVLTTSLDFTKRLSCLEETGIALLLQRLAFSYTRSVIEVEVLHASVAHLLVEAELLEQWVEDRAAAAGAATSDLILSAEEEFDGLMNEIDSVPGKTHRDRLKDPATRAAVRRLVAKRLGR